MSYGPFYSLGLSPQALFSAMVWPLVVFLPPWINDIQKFFKLWFRFTLLHHGQVVIESSQAGPEIFVTQAPCQILIKVSKE